MRIPFLLAVAATALCACKGKPTATPSGGSGAGSGVAPVAAKTGSGSGTMGALVPNAGSNIAPDIVLPHSDGSAPPKTTGPLPAAKITALSLLQFPGFLRDVRKVTDSRLEVRHKTDSRPRIMATVYIDPCGSACTPMQLDAWKAKTEDLKVYLTPDLKAAPDTQFEVGETKLDGVPAIYTWQLGQTLKTGSDGNTSGSFSHAYVLYYNDGENQVRVIAEYKDEPMATSDDMLKATPRADLEKVAKAFADVYTHGF